MSVIEQQKGGLSRAEGPLGFWSSCQSLSCAAPRLPSIIGTSQYRMALSDPGIFPKLP